MKKKCEWIITQLWCLWRWVALCNVLLRPFSCSIFWSAVSPCTCLLLLNMEHKREEIKRERKKGRKKTLPAFWILYAERKRERKCSGDEVTLVTLFEPSTRLHLGDKQPFFWGKCGRSVGQISALCLLSFEASLATKSRGWIGRISNTGQKQKGDYGEEKKTRFQSVFPLAVERA